MNRRDKKTAHIPIDIFNIDPVAGPSRNKQKNIRVIGRNVKNYITVLATKENLIGFEPRDLSKTQFQSGKTNRLYLPMPDDHLMAVLWSRDLVKRFLLSGSKNDIFYSNKKAKGELKKYAEEYKKKASLQVIKGEEELYSRKLSTENAKVSIETYYQYGFSDKKTSIHGDAKPMVKHAQQISAQINTREVTKNLSHYQHHPFFVNIHHEAQFSKVYPAIYQWIIGTVNTIEHETFKTEYQSMPKSTQKYFADKLGIKNIDEYSPSNEQTQQILQQARRTSPLNYHSNLHKHEQILQLINGAKITLEPGTLIEQTVKFLEYYHTQLSHVHAVTPSDELHQDINQLRELTDIIGRCKDEDAIKSALGEHGKNLITNENGPIAPIIHEAFSLLFEGDALKEQAIDSHLGKVRDLKNQVIDTMCILTEKYFDLIKNNQPQKAAIIKEKIQQLDSNLDKINYCIAELTDKEKQGRLCKMDYVDLKISLKEQEVELSWGVKNTLRLSQKDRLTVATPSNPLNFGTANTESLLILKQVKKSFSEESLAAKAMQKNALIHSHHDKIIKLKTQLENTIGVLVKKFAAVQQQGQLEKANLINKIIGLLRKNLAEIKEYIKKLSGSGEFGKIDDTSFDMQEKKFRTDIKQSLTLDESEKKIINQSGNQTNPFKSLFSYFPGHKSTAKVFSETEKSFSEPPDSSDSTKLGFVNKN